MIKRIVMIISIIAVLCIIAYCGYSFLFSNITEVDTKSTVGEISGILLSFSSIVVSILLGIFVYFQAERINTLEVTQYDVFLGVEKIDDSISLATEMILLSKNKSDLAQYAKLFETTCANELALYAYVHISDKSEKTFLPFVFVTRNTPLITAIHIKKILLNMDYKECHCKGKKNIKKDFIVDAAPVYKFLSDQSRFIFGLGIHGVHKSEIEKADVQIELVAEDQLGRMHLKKIEVSMVRIDKEIRLISSKSK